MTKSTSKGKVKRHKKKTVEEEEEAQDIPQPPSPVIDDEEENVAQIEEVREEASGADAESDDDDDDEETPKCKVPQLSKEVEQDLAEFFQENEIFYDKSRSDFKNSKKKDRLLQEKGAKLNMSGECKSKYIYCAIGKCFYIITGPYNV